MAAYYDLVIFIILRRILQLHFYTWEDQKIEKVSQ